MTDVIYRELCEFLDREKERFFRLSDQVWSTPELAYHEFSSAEAVRSLLHEMGFAVETDLAGIPTAFRGVWGRGKPVIGFLGEFDALPGLSQEAGCGEHRPLVQGGPGHGCGHNTISAACCAAAYAMKKLMEKQHLPGTLIVYGCPAEESGCGKSFMTRAGIFDELDVALAPHPGTDNAISGMSFLANIQATFAFRGTPAHAAISPEKGRSALDAASLMIVGSQFLREHVTTQARFHHAYIDAGGPLPNVVQPDAKLMFYIRAPKAEQCRDIFARLSDVARGAALMTGTQVEIGVESGMREFIPNAVLGQLAERCWREIGPVRFSSEALETARRMAPAVGKNPEDPDLLDLGVPVFRLSEQPMPASTDVGDVSIVVPAVMLMFTGEVRGTAGHSWQVVAQGGSPLMREGFLHAAKVMAAMGMELVRDPELTKEAKKELMERTGRRYESLIPENVRPNLG